MVIMSALESPPSSHIEYTTPTCTYLGRIAIKILELWRAFSSSLESLFSGSPDDNKIQRGELLQASDIEENIQNLDDIVPYYELLHHEILELDTNFRDIVNRANENDLIVLPYIIKGWLRNHIVFFAANPNTQEIIFYDPKGWTIADYNKAGLRACYDALKGKYPGYSLVQNTKQEQRDTFNCGIYVINKIRLLSESKNTNFRKLPSLDYQDAMNLRASNGFNKIVPANIARKASLPTDYTGNSGNDF